MEILYQSLYNVLECPNIRIKKPSWIRAPSAMMVFSFLLVTYFLVTGGKCVSVNNHKNVFFFYLNLLIFKRNNL